MDLHYLANYEIEHEIGQGSFATVYLGHEKTTKYKVAIKSVNLARLNKKLAENLASEITILKEISHPNIVKLYEIQKTENFIYLVMEYCHIGDLAQYLRTERVLKEGQARIFLQQLISALKILWENNLIHRDLKPQNLLLSEGDDGGLVIKIADFGFARYVEPTDLAETLCGSPLYMAPEILRYEKYDAKADLWSVGAIGYEMVFGHPPYRADNHIHLLRIIEKSDDLKLIFPTEITFKTSIKGLDRRYWSKTTTTSTVKIESSDLLKDLLLKLLRKDPSQRIGFQDLFSHPFVAVNEKNVQTEPQKVRGLSLHSTRRLSSSASCQSISSTDLAMTDMLHSNVEDEYLFSQLFQDLDKKAPIFASLKNYVSLVLMLDRIINIEAQQSMSLSISRAFVTENKKSKAHNALLILYYNIDLLENCLDIIKSALVRATEKSSDLLNVAQLISSKLDREYEQFESVKLSIKPTAAFTSSSLSRSNSSSSFMDDNFTTNQAIDFLIFQTACRFAKEGGIQELLENFDDSQALYLLSIFLFNILLNPAEFVPITSKFAQIATCSEYNQKIILKYIDVIQDRIK